MKRLFSCFVLLFCLIPQRANQYAAPVVIQTLNLRTVVHQIEFDQLSNEDGCSSSAVGLHTLLTDAHCVLGTSIVKVDDISRHIIAATYDESDHALLQVDGDAFPAFLIIDQRLPVENEKVRILGWPGMADDPVYREGFYKHSEYGSPMRYRWQLPVFPGDSGSPIVADDGKLITTVSLGNSSAEAVSFVLAFTPEQLRNIR